MLRWRNEDSPALPSRISEIAEALQCEQWRRELSYTLSYADLDSGVVAMAEMHELRSWAVDIERRDRNDAAYTESHVIFWAPTYTQKFSNMTVALTDSTYDSVPNTEGAYQLLTLKIDYNGVVSIITIVLST